MMSTYFLLFLLAAIAFTNVQAEGHLKNRAGSFDELFDQKTIDHDRREKARLRYEAFLKQIEDETELEGAIRKQIYEYRPLP